MSPFEQQVAEALKDLHTQWAFSSTDFEFSNLLAPRVAAAIQGAIARHRATIDGEWPQGAGQGFEDQEQAAALAALRGTPP